MRKISIRQFATIALLGFAFALLPTAGAQAADVTIQTGCGQSMKPEISGGLAYWKASCDGNIMTVKGWVKDTADDDECARVKANLGGIWHYSDRACPKGKIEWFTFKGPDKNAQIYLYRES